MFQPPVRLDPTTFVTLLDITSPSCTRTTPALTVGRRQDNSTSELVPTSSVESESSSESAPSTSPPPPPPSSTASSSSLTSGCCVVSSTSSSETTSISISISMSTLDPPPPSSTSILSSPPPVSSTSSTMSGNDPGSPDGISTTTTTTTPYPPPSSSSSTGVTTPTSDTVVPPPSSSTPPTSSPTDTGGPDQISTSTISSGGGGSSSSISTSQNGGDNTPPSSTTTRRDIYTVSNGDVHTYSVIPDTTIQTAVSFTTTDSRGSTLITIPPEFTTIYVTTDPGGQYTSVTEVIANPPGVLNPGGDNRASASAFFQNKGAVAGVFIAAALAMAAIVLFLIFAFRRRRDRIQQEREAGIAAALSDSRHQRLADEGGMRSVPSGLRNRSPWPDDDEEEDEMYASGPGPIVYSNFSGVGPPVHNMSMTQARPFPAAPIVYAPARTHSRSPSPKADSALLPASPTLTSGLPYLTRQTGSISPDPTNSGSALHAGTSTGHTSYRPPGSAGKSGDGSGETVTPQNPQLEASTLDNIYPPAYTQFANSSGTPSPRIGVAYEPEPMEHSRQITAGLPDLQVPDMPRPSEDAVASSRFGDPAGGGASVASRSLYSQDGSEDWNVQDVTPREDHRIDPLMRIRGGLVSAVSVGPRDHEDYMRRVIQPPLNSPSSGSHSHSQSHSHSHTYSTH